MIQGSPVIAVLLTCHNRKDTTLRCLDTLFSQQGNGERYRMDVFLVDDGSTDGTGTAVAARFPQVHLIRGDGNLFWNRGLHLAWESATANADYDFYLWLNDDTFLYPQAVNIMLGSVEKAGPDAIITGATQSAVTKQCTYGGETRDGKKVIPNGSLQRCELMNGNFVLISRVVFEKVGMLDPLFHHAIGDRDYGLRAIKRGCTILLTGEYIGTCEGHVRLPRWCLPDVPLRQRMSSLYSPLGYCHPYYFFVYEKRHFGILPAVKHFFLIHLRMLIPVLWKGQ